MRAHAVAFLNDAEASPDSPEAGVAHRVAGATCWFAGEYCDANDHLERALALFQSGRDDDMAFRFGQDPGIAAMANLAIASWPLGEVDRAMSLIDAMETRMSGVPHIGTLSFGRMHAALFELMRGDTLAALRTPSSLPGSLAIMSCRCGALSACFSRVGQPLRATRSALTSMTCVKPSTACARKT